MSTIAENITRIQGAKNDIRTAIVGKGVDVPADAHIDEYAGYIQNIKTGGGEPSGKMMIPNGIILSGSTFSTIDMSNWDWSRVYDWGSMFRDCSNLETIENFPSDVEVLYTQYMCMDCSKLITVSQFDTSNVTNMSYMFCNCHNLVSIPPFDTSNVTDMSYMFCNCDNLVSIPPLDISNVTDMSNMFYDCGKITEIRFVGNPPKINSMSNAFSLMSTNGRMYYPAEYAESYQQIINALPSTWTAVGE